MFLNWNFLGLRPFTFTVLASLTLVPSIFSAQTLIPAGSVWRYRADGSDQGTAWSQPGFITFGWTNGVGPLGFGDSHIVTILPSGFVTYYFRKEFLVNDPSSVASLQLRLLRDDGAVVYLNGVEVHRSNMPGGPITFNTLAIAPVSAPDETNYFQSAIPTSLLLSATNVLAVEVHQQTLSSSDLGFDAALVAEIGDSIPPTIVSATGEYGGPTLIVRFNEPVDPNAATDIFNYFASGSDGSGISFIVGISIDPQTVGLSLDPFTPFVQGVSYTLEACCICDISGNCMQGQQIPITFQIPPTPIVARGSVWRYLDTGVDPGPSWFDPFFDDSFWLSGPAELGYGDFDEATVINNTDPNTGGRLITAYFRQTFNVNDVSAISGLSLHLWRDDGAIVYINGTEVFRNNMPPGPATYSTLANALANDDGDVALSASLSPGVLLNGLNLIAVEVHQQAPTSSDISFDLELLVGNGPPNERPIANSQSVVVQFNTPTPITLTGSDPNGDNIIFILVTTPANGTLTGTAPNLTYRPNSGFSGADSFTFKVNDGQLDSAVATVSLNVQAGQNSLVARGSVWRYLDTGVDPGTAWIDPFFDDSSWLSGPAQLGYGDFDEATVINSTDASGQRLLTAYFRHTFNVADASAIGGLSLRLWRDDGAIVYLNGVELFRDNMPAGPANYSTLASITVPDDGNNAVLAQLSSSLLVNGANVIAAEIHQATPTSSDITFDLQLDPSTPPPNNPPTANGQSVTTFKNTAVAIALTGSDPDGNPLTFTVTGSPSHGSLSGTPPNVTYSPAADYVGPDSFTFKVNDGQLDSADALVSIQVLDPNQITHDLERDYSPGQNPDGAWSYGWKPTLAGAFNLFGHHTFQPLPGGVVLDFWVKSISQGAPPSLYHNGDVAFLNGDGTVIAPGAVWFGAGHETGTETFGAIRFTVPTGGRYRLESVAKSILDSEQAGDYDFHVVKNGVELFGVFMPARTSTGYTNEFDLVSGDIIDFLAGRGADNTEFGSAIRLRAKFSSLDSPPGNQPPTADNQSVATFQNTPVAITLTGSDPDGDPLTFNLTFVPSHGTLSGTPPNLTYTPALDYSGPDGFAFTVSDGEFESTNAIVSIQVVPPPNPPDIVSAIATCDGSSVIVTYDEPVDPPPATDVFNYIITDSNGNPAFIFNAILADAQTVVLFVDPGTPLIPGQAYFVTAFFICDTVGDCAQEQTAPVQFETVPPVVSCSVAVHTLLPANNLLVNVGLNASASEGTVQVQVFSDEPEVASLQDAVFTGSTLQLRARKSPSSDGRVYLIVVTAADPCGNVGVCCTTVVVPASPSQASINAVNAQAAAAQAQCSPTGAPSTPHQILP